MQIDNVLNTNGILIHLQDPNGDFLGDTTYLNRLKVYHDKVNQQPKKSSLKDLIPKPLKKFIRRQLGKKDYIDLVNDELLKEKVIGRRMTADEIWSVTDIHVETKDNFVNKGISLQFLKNELQNFTLINWRSYGFFGVLKSDLLEEFVAQENELISKNDCTGRNISCVWVKNE